MSIRVSWSPNQQELASKLIHLQDEARRPLVVLCRTTAMQTMLGHLLAHGERSQIDKTTALRLTTFDGWVRDLWIKYGDGRQQIDDVARRIYLMQVIEEVDEPLPTALSSPAGRSLLESVCQQVEPGVALPPSTFETVQLVATIAKQYQIRIASHDLIDTGEVIRYLCDEPVLLDHDLVLYGFSDLTRPQRLLLQRLKESTVIHVLSIGERGSLMRQHTERMIDQLSGNQPVVDEDIRIGGTGEPTTILRDLAEQFYGERVNSLENDPALVMFRSASGSRAQIVALISEIKRLQTRGDIRRIAVVLPKLNRYTPNLVRELERQGINYQFDLELPLEGTGFGIAFRALLHMASDVVAAGTIFDYTGSLFSEWSAKNAIAYDRLLRRGATIRESGPARTIGEATSWYQEVTGGRSDTLELVLGCLHDCSQEMWQEILDQMLAHAIEGGLRSSYQHVVTLAAYRAISITLHELAQVKKDRITGRELLEALTGGTVQINPVYGTRDVVFTTPNRVDGLVYDAVIIGGTDSGSFKGTTTLSGSEQILNLLGIGRFVGKNEQHIEEALSSRNQFYEASLLRAPQKHLSIIFQRHDDEGRELQPSGFLEEVVSQFQTTAQSFKETWEKLTQPNSEFLWDSPAVIKSLTLEIAEPENYGMVEISGRGEHTIEVTDPGRPLAVTEIERYMKCPYDWFLTYHVGGEEFDRDHDVRAVGTYVHALLERVFSRWHDAGKGAVTENNLAQIEELAQAVMHEYEDEGYLRLKEKQPDEYLRVEMFVLTILASEPSLNLRLGSIMRPVLFETKIEPNDDVRIGDAVIRGTIDRIDTSKSHYLVTDYKGTITKNQDLMIRDRDLQVGLYLLILEQLVGREDHPISQAIADKEPAGALYRSYRTGKESHLSDQSVIPMNARSSKLKPEEHATFVSQIEQIEQLAQDAITGMHSGDIELPVRDPKQQYRCSYCLRLRCPQRRVSTWKP